MVPSWGVGSSIWPLEWMESMVTDVLSAEGREQGVAGASLPAIEVRNLSRRFGAAVALERVSLKVHRGEIHALLGPNGAGKTTLLRILTGLVEPDGGEVRVLGNVLQDLRSREYRRLLGLVPSGDRTFYLRLSGYENLLFFGRLCGLGRAKAAERARAGLEAVGLSDAADKSVGLYSHGMHKRLSVARTLLAEPVILLIDEATHDLDPEAARRVRDLVAEAVAGGAAAIWTTQRLEEIRGFAQWVTLLDHGRVRFSGTVTQLLAVADQRRHVVRLRANGSGPAGLLEAGAAALGSRGALTPSGDGDSEHFVMALGEGVVLGEAIAALAGASLEVLACREERSELERAFLHLVDDQVQ
jgi:ABC-2 type transport system ATP-binding protein